MSAAAKISFVSLLCSGRWKLREYLSCTVPKRHHSVLFPFYLLSMQHPFHLKTFPIFRVSVSYLNAQIQNGHKNNTMLVITKLLCIIITLLMFEGEEESPYEDISSWLNRKIISNKAELDWITKNTSLKSIYIFSRLVPVHWKHKSYLVGRCQGVGCKQSSTCWLLKGRRFIHREINFVWPLPRWGSRYQRGFKDGYSRPPSCFACLDRNFLLPEFTTKATLLACTITTEHIWGSSWSWMWVGGMRGQILTSPAALGGSI